MDAGSSGDNIPYQHWLFHRPFLFKTQPQQARLFSRLTAHQLGL
ncbi:hypothetical protein [Yeguia hominis]|nr:hypothetical protein [Yeguia hominis]